MFDGHVSVGEILHISGHTCLCMGRSKVMSGIILDHSYFIHWGWVSLSNPEFAYMTNLASQLAVEIHYLLVSEAVITVRPPCLPEMYRFLEFKPQSPCLNGKCFGNWAISLAPNLFFFFYHLRMLPGLDRNTFGSWLWGNIKTLTSFSSKAKECKFFPECNWVCELKSSIILFVLDFSLQIS